MKYLVIYEDVTPNFLKSILDVNRELNELITKVRENRVFPDDLSNGTFTISNLGFADIDYLTPILRHRKALFSWGWAGLWKNRSSKMAE